MHALEDEALGIALHRHDALAAQDIRALLLGQAVDPGHELCRIDIALEPHRHRLHVLVMIVLEAMMMMLAVVMMVVVVMIMVMVFIADQKFGLDVEDAVEIEGAPLEHVGERDVAFLRPMQRRVRVDGPNARLDLAQFGRA